MSPLATTIHIDVLALAVSNLQEPKAWEIAPSRLRAPEPATRLRSATKLPDLQPRRLRLLQRRDHRSHGALPAWFRESRLQVQDPTTPRLQRCLTPSYSVPRQSLAMRGNRF